MRTRKRKSKSLETASSSSRQQSDSVCIVEINNAAEHSASISGPKRSHRKSSEESSRADNPGTFIDLTKTNEGETKTKKLSISQAQTSTQAAWYSKGQGRMSAFAVRNKEKEKMEKGSGNKGKQLKNRDKYSESKERDTLVKSIHRTRSSDRKSRKSTDIVSTDSVECIMLDDVEEAGFDSEVHISQVEQTKNNDIEIVTPVSLSRKSDKSTALERLEDTRSRERTRSKSGTVSKKTKVNITPVHKMEVTPRKRDYEQVTPEKKMGTNPASASKAKQPKLSQTGEHKMTAGMPESVETKQKILNKHDTTIETKVSTNSESSRMGLAVESMIQEKVTPNTALSESCITSLANHEKITPSLTADQGQVTVPSLSLGDEEQDTGKGPADKDKEKITPVDSHVRIDNSAFPEMSVATENEQNDFMEHNEKCESPQTPVTPRTSSTHRSAEKVADIDSVDHQIKCPVSVATESGAMVILKHPNEYVIEGRVKVKVLCGSVETLGHKLQPGQRAVDIFSVAFQSFLTITTISGEGDPVKVRDILSSNRLDEVESGSIAKSVAENDLTGEIVILEVEPLRSRTVNYLTNFYSKLFSSETQEFKRHAKTALSPLGVHIYQQMSLPSSMMKSDSEDIMIEKWKESLLKKTDASPPVVILCGARNSGKSTNCRRLINATLNSLACVYYMECDVGQTEFTPSGCVSLHQVSEPVLGPPCCHQRRPVSSYYFGGLTAGDDPGWYLQCVEQCYTAYKQLGTDVPLVINTMGWVTGLGLQLLLDIIRLVDPSLVVQLSTGKHIHDCRDLTPQFVTMETSWKDMHESQQTQADNRDISVRGKHDLIVLNSQAVNSRESFSLRAPDHRHLSLLGHLSSDLEPGVTLTSAVPYQIRWGCVVVHTCHVNVPRDQIMYALNGSVVGLCHTDTNSPDVERIGDDLPLFFKSSTPVCQLLGYGIVRAIDPKKKVFYIVTSVSPSDLQKVNVLMKGGLSIPERLMLKQNEGLEQIYINSAVNTIGSGALRHRRFMPRKQHT